MSTARNPMSIDPLAVTPTAAPAKSTSGLAIAALVAGILSIVLLVIPPLGLLVSLVGLGLGIAARRQGTQPTLALVAIVLSSVALALMLAVIVLLGAILAIG